LSFPQKSVKTDIICSVSIVIVVPHMWWLCL